MKKIGFLLAVSVLMASWLNADPIPDGVAYVFLKRDGAQNLGHVGGAFLFKDKDGTLKFRCFATENPKGTPVEPAKTKGFWTEVCPNNHDDVVAIFKKRKYTDWKKLEIKGAYPDLALAMMEKRSKEDYNVASRNCENDVYDVLHNEEMGKRTGYGVTANSFTSKVYIGWVQEVRIGPNIWFDEHIGATSSGKIK